MTPVAMEEKDNPPETGSGRIKVLYIGGNARCGSTLLGRLLGSIDGFELVGEPQSMWNRCFRENRLCGCGMPFRECEFWSSVVEEAFGGFDTIDLKEIEQTKWRLERIKTVPRLLWRRMPESEKAQVDRYLNVLRNLYRGIQKVSGAKVIVDGSKSPLYAYFLARTPEIDLRAVHLIRDSRAVAYSNLRKKANPAIHWAKESFGTTSPARSSARWAAQNILMENIRHDANRSIFMRYEDFVGAPQAAVDQLCALVDEPTPAARFGVGEPIYLGTSHTTSGNPDRFGAEITIRMDSEWKKKLSKRHKVLVTALTLPLLLHYGYVPGS